MDEPIPPPAQGFDALVRPHFEALYRAAMRLTRRREDAEDLVQDVVLRALAELERLESLESPRGWLMRVQYRLFVDGVRRRARSPVVGTADSKSADSASPEDTAASDWPGPEELTERAGQRRQLARVWHELNRRQRALLALHAEGYSLAELEQITGLSRNAIGVRLHRARSRLATLIKQQTAAGPELVRLEDCSELSTG